jgi:hypothetical protein
VGERTGGRLLCAQKIFEPTHIRLLRGLGRSPLRSIECEFDHLFLVEPGLETGCAFCRSQGALESVWRVGERTGGRLLCAQKIFEPTHIRLLRRKWGEALCVASNVSSIICFWPSWVWRSGARFADLKERRRLWRVGERTGGRLHCAQKIFEPTHIRLLRRKWGEASA